MQLRRNAWQISPNPQTGFIAIRFRGGAFRHFCSYTADETHDRCLDVRDIWGKEGGRMTEQILEAETFPLRIAVIEQCLLRFLAKFRRDDIRIEHAIQCIYYGGPHVRFDAIKNELNISSRHFQRIFKNAMGISPKEFQRITRFQKTVKHLLLRKQSCYLDPALAFGYYDQAHFIKEFRAFAGETPAMFLQEKNFMAHFYNRSLSGPSILAQP